MAAPRACVRPPPQAWSPGQYGWATPTGQQSRAVSSAQGLHLPPGRSTHSRHSGRGTSSQFPSHGKPAPCGQGGSSLQTPLVLPGGTSAPANGAGSPGGASRNPDPAAPGKDRPRGQPAGARLAGATGARMRRAREAPGVGVRRRDSGGHGEGRGKGQGGRTAGAWMGWGGEGRVSSGLTVGALDEGRWVGWTRPGAGSPGDTMGPCPAARRPEQTHTLQAAQRVLGPAGRALGQGGAGLPGAPGPPCVPGGAPARVAAPQARCPEACGPGGSLSQDSRGLHHSAVSGGLAIRPTRRPDTEAKHPVRGLLRQQGLTWTPGPSPRRTDGQGQVERLALGVGWAQGSQPRRQRERGLVHPTPTQGGAGASEGGAEGGPGLEVAAGVKAQVSPWAPLREGAPSAATHCGEGLHDPWGFDSR